MSHVCRGLTGTTLRVRLAVTLRLLTQTMSEVYGPFSSYIVICDVRVEASSIEYGAVIGTYGG